MTEALVRIVEARKVETVWETVVAEMNRWGFDRLIYGFTRFRTGRSLGDRDDMLVLTSHCDDYLRGFFDEEMYLDAPMTEWAAENVGAMSWAHVGRIASNMGPRQQRVREFNIQHDVVAGYTISFPDSSSRQKGAIALTARRGLTQDDIDEVWKAHGKDISLIAHVAHLKIISLPFPDASRRLSRRQREVLEWVGDGKTAHDIATIMGLTSATVEKHLRKAREVLRVDTTAQAVLKASLQRQIFVLEP